MFLAPRKWFAANWRLLVVILGVLDLSVVPLILWKQSTRIGLADPESFTMGSRTLDDVWFTPQGKLAIASHTGLVLNLFTYTPGGDAKGIKTKQVDFYQVLERTPGRPGELSSNLPLYSDGLDSKLLYAVSDDAESVAWSNRRVIRVRGIEDILRKPDSQAGNRIEANEDVYSLVLTSGSTYISYLDARRKVTTYKGPQKIERDVGLGEGRWRLASRGPFVAALDDETGNSGLLILDLKALEEPGSSGRAHRWQTGPPFTSGSTCALAGSNRLIIGDVSGVITSATFDDPAMYSNSADRGAEDADLASSFAEGSEDSTEENQVGQSRQAASGVVKRSLLLPVGGGIRAIASLGKGQFLVAGEFPGLYMLPSLHLVQKIAGAPSDIRKLVANDHYVAFATARQVILMKQVFSFRLSETGKYMLGLVFSVLGLLGFIRASIDSLKQK